MCIIFCFSRDSMFSLNPEQESAVENIVHAKNYPLPYILHGPPGKCSVCYFLMFLYRFTGK